MLSFEQQISNNTDLNFFVS